MTRYFLSCFALVACLCCLSGCGPAGGEAKLDESSLQDMTAAEEQAAADYEKELAEIAEQAAANE